MIIVTTAGKQKPAQHQDPQPAQQVDQPIERPPVEQGGVVEGRGDGQPEARRKRGWRARGSAPQPASPAARRGWRRLRRRAGTIAEGSRNRSRGIDRREDGPGDSALTAPELLPRDICATPVFAGAGTRLSCVAIGETDDEQPYFHKGTRWALSIKGACAKACHTRWARRGTAKGSISRCSRPMRPGRAVPLRR